jgi:hypothetical protein
VLKVFVVRVWFPASGGELENIGKLFTLNHRWAKWLHADHSVAMKRNFDVPGERYEIFGVLRSRGLVPVGCVNAGAIL